MAKVAEEREHAKEHGKRIRKVNLDRIPRDIELLKAADVWVLNEVDWGVKRTRYREVVRELSTTWFSKPCREKRPVCSAFNVQTELSNTELLAPDNVWVLPAM